MRHALPLLALTLACDLTTLQPPEQCAEELSPRAPVAPPPVAAPAKLVLHEWGTFTAVAGPDGAAVTWRPLASPSDLPGFVHSQSRPGLRGQARGKNAIAGTVRMETPVIYFYVDEPREVTLSVGFKNGTLTEWYPQVAGWTGDRLDWGTFQLLPPNPADLARIPEPTAHGHYFAARATDAAVVRVCSPDHDEHEKFLFYRGVGSFDLSLSVRLADDRLTLRTPHPAGVPALVFERRGTRIGFNKGHVGPGGLTLQRPTLDDALTDVTARLEALLLAEGLYARESAAMLATWQDHWFEDGLRVFYLLPAAEVDALLPLQVDPAPTERVRTIIGRVEVVTPELETAVRADLTAPARDLLARCKALQAHHGRFAEPVVRRIADTTASPRERTAATGVLEQIASGACVVAE